MRFLPACWHSYNVSAVFPNLEKLSIIIKINNIEDYLDFEL